MANKYDLQLRGSVGSYAFDADYIGWYLNSHHDSPVNILIESRGGSLAHGFSICSAIREHKDVSVHFVGMCASAATVASLGAKHISMACDAWYLVHKASIGIFEWSSMNADQIEQKCRELDKKRAELAKFDVAISQMYSRRCKKDPKDMLELMSRETWLSAKEALEWGFIDEITDLPDDVKNEITDEVIEDFVRQGIALPPGLIPVKGKEGGIFSKILNLLTSNHKMDPQNITPTPDASKGSPGDNKPDQKTSPDDSLQNILDRLDKIESNLSEKPEGKPGKEGSKADAAADTVDSSESPQVVNLGSTQKKTCDDFSASIKSASDLYNSLP